MDISENKAESTKQAAGRAVLGRNFKFWSQKKIPMTCRKKIFFGENFWFVQHHGKQNASMHSSANIMPVCIDSFLIALLEQNKFGYNPESMTPIHSRLPKLFKLLILLWFLSKMQKIFIHILTVIRSFQRSKFFQQTDRQWRWPQDQRIHILRKRRSIHRSTQHSACSVKICKPKN